jgi:excisionase family DNA binding protein
MEPATVNGPPGEVLTLAEAAAYLRFSEADVMRLVHEQGLPARRLANEWRFLKAGIQRWLTTPFRPYSKEGQTSVIGSWKDDPDLEDMLEEIYRQRGRPITEDGSYRLFHGLKRERDST